MKLVGGTGGSPSFLFHILIVAVCSRLLIPLPAAAAAALVGTYTTTRCISH